MSVQTQIDRISDAVSAVKAALTEKGVTVPAGTKVDGIAPLIAAIEAGGGGGINLKTCTVNISITSTSVRITDIGYTTLDENGQPTAANQHYYNYVSSATVNCVCNTCLTMYIADYNGSLKISVDGVKKITGVNFLVFEVNDTNIATINIGFISGGGLN